jgi:hypothetical protein
MRLGLFDLVEGREAAVLRRIARRYTLSTVYVYSIAPRFDP